MVDVSEIKRSFRKFREDFWEDVTEINLEKGRDVDKVKTKMIESDYFKTVQDFVKERGWEVKNVDLAISAKKGEETVEIGLVDCADRNTLFIKPWSRVVERLKKLED